MGVHGAVAFLAPEAAVGGERVAGGVTVGIVEQAQIVAADTVEVTGVVLVVAAVTGRRAGQPGIAVTQGAELVLGRRGGAADHRQGAGGDVAGGAGHAVGGVPGVLGQVGVAVAAVAGVAAVNGVVGRQADLGGGDLIGAGRGGNVGEGDGGVEVGRHAVHAGVVGVGLVAGGAVAADLRAVGAA